MGVWDLIFFDNEVKKYLKLSLDGEFDEEQRAKFGQLAIEASGHLERHKANFGKTKNIDLACPEDEEIGTLRKIIYGMPDPETFDFEKYAVGRCCINGDASDPDIRCRRCEWEGFSKSF